MVISLADFKYFQTGRGFLIFYGSQLCDRGCPTCVDQRLNHKIFAKKFLFFNRKLIEFPSIKIPTKLVNRIVGLSSFNKYRLECLPRLKVFCLKIFFNFFRLIEILKVKILKDFYLTQINYSKLEKKKKKK